MEGLDDENSAISTSGSISGSRRFYCRFECCRRRHKWHLGRRLGTEWNDRNQVTVELKWDGKNLTGTVNPGANAVELKKATFDAKTGAIHFEADATNRRGNQIHYVIDGKVEGSTMTGTWNHDNRNGELKITKK